MFRQTALCNSKHHNSYSNLQQRLRTKQNIIYSSIFASTKTSLSPPKQQTTPQKPYISQRPPTNEFQSKIEQRHQQQFLMGILYKLKRLIKMNDFFYSSEMLRYEDEMEYRTLTGGLISLGIIVTIFIGFANMILDTLDLNTITTSMEVIKQQVPTPATLSTSPESKFMFAVQIWHLNLSDTRRFFDLTFRVDYESHGVVYNSIDLPLQACRRDHWASFPQVSDNFEKLMTGNWLCPPINSSYQLYGKYSSEQYSQYIIKVAACNNNTHPSRPCASPQQIKQYFDDNAAFFYFDFYFTNPLINPGQKDYKSYYLQDGSYAIFGDNLGSETFLYFTDYTIKTDYSIWPFENIVEDKGCIVENMAINHPFQTNIDGTYLTFSIVKSSNSLVYNRQVQKISSVFSFMGGMIGAVSAVLFVIKVYTSVAFQISIALQIFRPGKDSTVQKTGLGMNFWNFIKLNLFKISQLFGKPCEWPTMQYVEQCQKQILKQLDIKSLIKRVIFIEYCITYLFEDYQLDGLQLKKPNSPQQIKKIREKCESVLIESQYEKSQQSSVHAEEKQHDPPKIVIDPTIPMNNLGTPAEFIRKSEDFSENGSGINMFSGRGKLDGADQVIIVEMITDGKKYSQRMFGPNPKKNAVKNLHKQNEKRSSNLQFLHEKAAKGDAISHRIWNSLGQDLKQKVINHEEVETFQ